MSNKLLAPNGKPSNLNTTQYELVRTPAFKKWFGDWEKDPANASKVVDENGEPLVVYHGSYNQINKFTVEVNAHYFTNKRIVSETYGKNVLSCFLNIKKPVIWDANCSQFNDVENYINKLDSALWWAINKNESSSFYGVFVSENTDGVIVKEIVDTANEMSFEDFTKNKNKYCANIYMVSNSNQIKLADGTNTSFDSGNEDIRFEKGGELKAEDMLKHPLTIKRLKDLDDNYGYWINHYHAKTKNYKPNTYYHLNTNKGLNSGVGKGLYLGRDKDALISFYDLEGENKKVDAYFGNPKWLDLMDYSDYDRYEQEAIRKFDKNKVSKSNLLDLDSRGEMLKKLAIEKGFDGIRYYDPQATGEEFVLFDVKKVKKINDDISFAKGGKTKGDCYLVAGQLALEIKNKDIDYKGTPYLVQAEVKHSAIEGLRYGHAFIEDDENVYDFSNNREIIMPKQIYYYFGDINPRDKKKYRKYTFKEAREKMLSTGNYGCWDIEVDYEKGGRTIAQTPAPKKDQVQGSDINKKSSSKDLSSAKLIKFDDKTLDAIKNKVKEHNGEHPDKKINLSSAKAVVRRGMGAYSKSHRPTISGGKPNSRVAWGLARLNAFTYKIVNGKSKSGKYSQDDDLIEELGYKVANYENGGKMKDIRCINCGWEWNRNDSELWDMYVCHKCGFDNTSFYTSDGINRLLKGGKLNSNTGVTPNYLKMFLDL